MTRERAIAAAEAYFDEGGFAEDLARRVAIPSESQVPERASMLARYLDGEIAPSLQRLGFATETVANPAGAGPMLIAERREPGNRTTVLGYGHGDVVRGLEAEWAEGLSPWRLQRRGDRLYGRGTADNKGTRSISPPSTRRSRPAADSASTSSTWSRPARRWAPPACARCASNTATGSRPTY